MIIFHFLHYTLNFMAGFYVVYIVIFIGGENTISYTSAQLIAAFIPPMALQLGCYTFLKSYTDLPLASICGILVCDIFVYAGLAWYVAQVWPSALGVRKVWYFLFLPSYWLGDRKGKDGVNNDVDKAHGGDGVEMGGMVSGDDGEGGASIPIEHVNESVLGAPTVIIQNLCKSFDTYMAVNNLSFSMYENQIFALLGHNGAGKTTAINVLTGLLAPDYTHTDSLASVYGHSIYTHMENIRYSLGVCPQHDVLFEQLTLQEHILFFAQLKGFSKQDAIEEAKRLVEFFKLESRVDHLGGELSGGQKRMLSIAIAVCGGSKFVVFDEVRKQ
ncbi:ATP-binding cassette domain-containing protein [archaeon]|nr:MAG: ATP-binding cassette domain-containing protein [archaeon]